MAHEPSLNGRIVSVKRSSIHDGPGVRTTVFLKGCPLNCLWCHNPESQQSDTEIAYHGHVCTHCGNCAVCPQQCHRVSGTEHIFNRDECDDCGKCVHECFHGALEIVGTTMSVEQVMADVRKDKRYYDNSGGGITISGGEPLMQHEFSRALLSAARDEGIHTCVETCGYARPEILLQMIPYVDALLYDIKETDPDRHKRFTGVDNEIVLSNLHAADNAGAHIILRVPIIPGVNDREEHFRTIGAIAGSMKHCMAINIMPYHAMGVSKHASIGRDYGLDAPLPTAEQSNQWIETLSKYTEVTVTKG